MLGQGVWVDTSRLLASYNYHTPTHQLPVAVDRQTDRQTDRTFILINHSSFAIKMSQPNINTPNSDLISSLSQSQSYLSPNFLVILPGLTSSVRLCGVERCPAQQSEEEEEEEPKPWKCKQAGTRGQDYKRFSSMSRCSTHNLCSEMT